MQRKTRMVLLDTLGATLIGTLTPVSRIAADLLTISERILNVERLFNLRQGATQAEEDPPDRFTEEPLPNGPARGMTVAIQPMVRDFYAAMAGMLTAGPRRRSCKNWDWSSSLRPLRFLKTSEVFSKQLDLLTSWPLSCIIS